MKFRLHVCCWDGHSHIKDQSLKDYLWESISSTLWVQGLNSHHQACWRVLWWLNHTSPSTILIFIWSWIYVVVIQRPQFLVELASGLNTTCWLLHVMASSFKYYILYIAVTYVVLFLGSLLNIEFCSHITFVYILPTIYKYL